MLLWISLLFVLAAVLPMTGLARLARGVYYSFRDETAEISKHPATGGGIHIGSPEGGTRISTADFVASTAGAAAKPLREWRKVRGDLYFVGGGLLCGAVASIWSLYV